ncbi:MAG: hypothetical protein LBO79_06390 [Zoogloeaceae bacterium]|jgi:hypothetical protein|nr:hypothetical protein [Zoogloeaceae bacterium]
MTPKNPVRQVVTVAALAVFFTLSTLSCTAWGQGVHVEETEQAVDCGASKESACARLEQGAALMAQGKYTAAIAVLDRIVRRFGTDASPAMREIVGRYGKDATPGVRKQVARALVSKGLALIGKGVSAVERQGCDIYAPFSKALAG